jgi:hypothetical protein
MRHRLAFWVLSPLLWTGCARGVGPRPRLHTGASARIVGCLDIDVGARRDLVLTFDVANRCPQPVALEFRNLVVRAWSADGTEDRPTPSGPRNELFQAQLDGHQVERVVLAYPVWAENPRFCVDVARLNVDQPAPHPVEVCFRYAGGGKVEPDSPAERRP